MFVSYVKYIFVYVFFRKAKLRKRTVLKCLHENMSVVCALSRIVLCKDLTHFWAYILAVYHAVAHATWRPHVAGFDLVHCLCRSSKMNAMNTQPVGQHEKNSVHKEP